MITLGWIEIDIIGIGHCEQGLYFGGIGIEIFDI
jgi:hypothetical protein